MSQATGTTNQDTIKSQQFPGLTIGVKQFPRPHPEQQFSLCHGYASGYAHASSVDNQIAGINQWLDPKCPDRLQLNRLQKEMLSKSTPAGSEGYFVVAFSRTMIAHCEGESA